MFFDGVIFYWLFLYLYGGVFRYDLDFGLSGFFFHIFFGCLLVVFLIDF